MALPKRPLVITIDDGYLDNWLWAFPLLKKYDLKATIFVSPEMVDPRELVRQLNDRNFDTGYLTWQEMKVMEASGLVDIQSHTMSHTKYNVSDKIIGFHRKGGDCLYPIGNLYPDKRPFYIANSEFESLLPYGTPFFEERSSVIAKRVFINPDFIKECVDALRHLNLTETNLESAFKQIEPLYSEYKKKNAILSGTETEADFKRRLEYEIVGSKQLIEKKLNKKVEFLSWPHGDNSKVAHDLAIANGYKATTVGKMKIEDSVDRVGERFGFKNYMSPNYGFFKLKTKIRDLEGVASARLLKTIFRMINIK